MKVMIPVDKCSSQSEICVSFGRTPYFYSYCTDTNRSEFIENAAAVLNAANIKIFKSTSQSIQDNIKSFIKGELSVLEEIHEGFHGYGGRK